MTTNNDSWIWQAAVFVAQGHKATAPMEMVCSLCGTKLMDIPVGEFYFVEVKSKKCDCAWRCCDAVQDEVHPAHRIYREQETGDVPQD